MKSYKTITETYEGYYEEKKSKFMAYVRPVTNEEEAKGMLTAYKKQYRDANHHCSAFIIGGDVPLERYGDDGEPAGTAGLPMLEVLRGKELSYVFGVVIRYFGGTKLGTGGLVRAYTKAIQDALDNAEIIEKGVYIKYQVKVPYTLSGKIDYHVQKEGLILVDTEYGTDVSYTFYCIKDKYEVLHSDFVELCNNQCEVIKLDECIGYVREGVFNEGA